MNAFPILMMLVIAGAFWFLILRPARARQHAQASLLNDLKIGQEVMTTAGLFGVVKAIDGDEVSLEIADGVVVRYIKQAIAKIIEPPDDDAALSDLESETVVIRDVDDASTATRSQ